MIFTAEFFLQALIVVGGLLGIYTKLRADIEVLKNDIGWIKKNIQQSNN